MRTADAFQWLVKYKWWKDEARMEMSNIDSNLNEGMTWYKMRVTTKTYYTSKRCCKYRR